MKKNNRCIDHALIEYYKRMDELLDRYKSRSLAVDKKMEDCNVKTT